MQPDFTEQDLFTRQSVIAKNAEVPFASVVRYAAQFGIKPVRVAGRYTFYSHDASRLVELIKSEKAKRLSEGA